MGNYCAHETELEFKAVIRPRLSGRGDVYCGHCGRHLGIYQEEEAKGD